MRTLAIATLVSLSSILCGGAAFGQGSADSYPSKPVSLVIASNPGGSTDGEMRLYSQRLTEILGKPFVMDYKPGAGGTIGSRYVAKAVPDGHTLLSISTAFTTSAAFYPDPGYDAVKDFQPISLITKRHVLMLASTKAPFKTFKEYVAYAKANPGKVNFSTTGNGASHHLIAAQMNDYLGISVTYIHYKNSKEKQADMLSGRVDIAFNSFYTGAANARAGKQVAMVVLTNDRSPLAPDWPALTEMGIPVELTYPAWLGMTAPARTPMPIINKLNATLAKIAREPEVAKRFEGDSVVVIASTPAQFQQTITQEITRWRTIADKIGVKGEVD